MKKLLSIAALILAFSPFAQAQDNGAGLPGHPDARNDRSGASNYSETMEHKNHMGAKPKHHAKSHHMKSYHPKRHHPKHPRHVVPAK
ncbi:MAG: hypothetical protein ABIO19_04375 [Burkholderiaceae bacterium]